MDRDPFYKDYKLADYRFIVANKKTLTPLVWIYDGTTSMSEFTTKDGQIIVASRKIDAVVNEINKKKWKY